MDHKVSEMVIEVWRDRKVFKRDQKGFKSDHKVSAIVIEVWED